jgi:tripartite ATP-independent transporter DctP family solute receptor
MMLKKFRCLALAMTLVLLFVSCTTFAAKKPIKLILGSLTTKTHFLYEKGDLYFKELVEKNSKGQIIVEAYPGGQLGTIPEEIQAVKNNAQQMTYTPVGEYVPYWPKLGTFDLPFLYRDQQHYLKVEKKFTSLIDQDEMAAKTGLRIIGVRIRTPRQLTTKFPVNKLEDIKGIKIRVPESPVSVALWKALGTVPTIIPASDVYTALATGTVDAQENPFEAIINMKVYEQAKYCALTAHKREVVPIVISEIFWKKLTSKQKKVILAAQKKSNKRVDDLTLQSESGDKAKLKKLGMKFTQPNLIPFREKAKTIWGQFGDKGLIKKIEAVK